MVVGLTVNVKQVKAPNIILTRMTMVVAESVDAKRSGLGHTEDMGNITTIPYRAGSSPAHHIYLI